MCQELLWVSRPAAQRGSHPPAFPAPLLPPSPLAIVPAALSTLDRRQNLCQPVAFFLRAVLSRGCSGEAAWSSATPLRQEVTGDTPSWWAGGGGSGRRPLPPRLQVQPTSHSYGQLTRLWATT